MNDMTSRIARLEVSGLTVAELSWQIPDSAMSALLPNADTSVFPDVRSQFAAWASSARVSQHRFPGGLAEAWDAFTDPQIGQKTRAVLLPGAICGRCSSMRFAAGSTGFRGFRSCPACKGTRRKPPAAIPAMSANQVPDVFAGIY